MGSGPDLLLVPGTFSDRRAWLKQLGLLTPRFRCLIFDPRGTGETPDPGRAFTPDDLVDDAVRLLDAVQVEQAHVVGHSLGATVALLLAARYPHRVRRVVAAAPTLYMDAHLLATMELWDALAASDVPDHALHLGLVVNAFGRRAFDRLVPAVVEEMDRRPVGRDTIRRYVACDREQDLRPHLARIDAAVLVVAGAEDCLSGPQQARAVATAISGARLESIDASGHSPHIESPREFGRLVLAHLTR